MDDHDAAVRELFCSALEKKSPRELADYLDQACGNSSAIRSRVEHLLQAHYEAGNFLRGAADDGMIDHAPIVERPGTQIGPYKLLEQIGEGGFGVVFLAEQDRPVRRRVALKIIKPGMDTREVIARFEAERQALALMDHPNIAKVFDAGTTGVGSRDESQETRAETASSLPLDSRLSTLDFSAGRPYFVMELVKGVPITDYCDTQHLTVRQRLELFTQVCQAVQHAHQKGIIHRDLKPTNVLVAEYDGRPVPKIIDFGVAKATAQRLTEKTMFTQFGQIVGTFDYMSPEQARFNQLDIDTRSDIYSLGVLLYELLAGSTPFDKERFRSAAFDEVLRIIREEEPPRPSTRLNTTNQLPGIAINRDSVPKKLSSLVKGDLDWVVMKALEKDRNRRYHSATNLAQDVERFLADEPVEARPPSALYLFRKFARRNGAVLLTTALLAIVLLAGSGFSTWQAFRATRAEGRAKDAHDREYQLRQEAESQRQRAESALAGAERQHKRAEENLRLALQSLDDIYVSAAHTTFLRDPQRERDDRELLQQALSFYDAFAQQNQDDPQARWAAGHVYWRMGSTYRSLGRFDEAEQLYRKAIPILQELVSQFPKAPEASDYASVLSGSYHGLGSTLIRLRRRGEAEDAFRKAVSIREVMARERPTLLGSSLAELGNLLRFTGRLEEADAILRRSHGIFFRLHSEANEVAEHKQYLARNYHYVGILRIAEKRFADAEQALAKSVDLRKELLAADVANDGYRQELACSCRDLGRLLANGDRLAEAEQTFRQAVSLTEDLVAKFPNSRRFRGDMKEGHDLLIGVLREAGQPDRAEEVCRQAIARWEELATRYPTIEDYRHGLARQHQQLAELLAATGRPAEAPVAHRQAIGDYGKAIELQPDNPASYNSLAWLLATSSVPQHRDPARAVELANRAVELQPKDGNCWNTLGTAQYRAGDWKAAMEALNKSVELNHGGNSFDWFFLAMIHWQLGEEETGRQWYGQAVEWMDANNPANEELIRFRAEAAELLGIAESQVSTNQQPSEKAHVNVTPATGN